MSFLIVDDNSVMRRTIRRVVDEFAREIIECSDGTEVFTAYEKHLPDWVLMDVEMREMDGLSATRKICEAYPNAHVIIVTKYGDAEMRATARQAGACAFVGKENLLELREFLRSEISQNYR